MFFVVIVPFVVLVIAGAGVLLVVAGRTVVEIQIEFLDHSFRIGCWLDLHDNGKVVAFRERLIRDKNIASLLHGHAGGIGATAAGDANGLFAYRNGLSILSECGDLHFAVLGHEEFEMRLDAVENFASVGAGVPVIVIMVVAFMLFVFVIFLVGLKHGGSDREAKRGCKCSE